MAFLEIMDVTKRFGDVTAVDGARISVEEGEFFTFLGPSGCGKTTTLRMIAGFEMPSEGKIIMEERDITTRPPEARHIGMMFQNYALFPHMTVYENVAYGLKIKKMKKPAIHKQVEAYLSLVGLEGRGKRKISQLSGGEQQRVALARSLATEPRLLLLDEPLSNLDAKMRDEMRLELKRLQRELKITMLYVTHDQSEALIMSDHIAVFNKGRVQQIGSPEEIYRKPRNTFVANFVGQTNLIDIEENRGDEVTLKGGVRVRTTHPLPGAHHVSLRNEYIHLLPPGAVGENAFAAEIVSSQFNGMTHYYTIAIQGLRLNVTAMNEGTVSAFQAGERATAIIPPQCLALLEV